MKFDLYQSNLVSGEVNYPPVLNCSSQAELLVLYHQIDQLIQKQHWRQSDSTVPILAIVSLDLSFFGFMYGWFHSIISIVFLRYFCKGCKLTQYTSRHSAWLVLVHRVQTDEESSKRLCKFISQSVLMTSASVYVQFDHGEIVCLTSVIHSVSLAIFGCLIHQSRLNNSSCQRTARVQHRRLPFLPGSSDVLNQRLTIQCLWQSLSSYWPKSLSLFPHYRDFQVRVSVAALFSMAPELCHWR